MHCTSPGLRSLRVRLITTLVNEPITNVQAVEGTNIPSLVPSHRVLKRRSQGIPFNQVNGVDQALELLENLLSRVGMESRLEFSKCYANGSVAVRDGVNGSIHLCV